MGENMSDNGKNFNNWEGEAFEQMLFEYLDNGYLENIITFFIHELSEIHLIPKMIADERLRVKVGAFAIIEELKERNPEILKKIVPDLIKLLSSSDRNIRGDAAYALEIIAAPESKAALLEAWEREEDPQIKDFIEDAIRALR